MEDAFQRLYKRSKHFTIENMDLLFYPYTLIEFYVNYGDKLQRLNGKVLCMADMWRGDYSIASSRGEIVTTNAEDNTVMPSRINVEDAIKNAPRTIYGEIQKAKKVLKIPDIDYVSHESIYKPFFIVECLNDDKEVFHILFDTVTGEYSLLNA
ncbi:MAG: hypothetical protein Q4A65_06695 [Bacillota bacterium]|nr:hypothetical protein [Bacillota bacterium]